MSHPSAVSGTAPLSHQGIDVQHLGGPSIPHSSYMQKMNPNFAGLITPPESPVRCAERESSDGSATQPQTPMTLEADASICPSSEARNAIEALSAAVQSAKAEKPEQHYAGFSNNSHGYGTALALGTPIDLGDISDGIHSVIEHAVEEKISDALSPLRLNINRLDDSLKSMDNLQAHLRREHTDIRDQNDTMSRQLDLHYRTIEQNIEEFRSQSKVMNTMIETQTTMVNHLSQVVMNLPIAISQVVHNAVQQQTQLAIREVMFAQQQAMFSISDVSGTRQSVSSDGSSLQRACGHHGLEIESISSTQHRGGSTEQSHHSAPPKPTRGFRHALRKLFKSSK
ncbi:hypothetical protein Trco_000254 [Trichoderma cornu-damae]|uniref:Uncharacterized protein n=1 Tax=Trichoderma cornu-damae TaxID=654480 RepID=A0A9P8TYU9_9HYPO|nr:hypothetical protein Trco_000254 [Trichoderma cornu-damae]